MKKIFISYSWDSDEHQQWVKKLADDLENYQEFHVVLDQYDLDSKSDKNLFMERAVAKSDIIIIIGTKKYAEKANNRDGGVGIETYLTSIRHWEENNKTGRSNLIAIAREDRNESIPFYLQGKFSIDFTNNDKYQEGFEKLIHELTDNNSISKRPPKTKSINIDKGKFFEFDRVDDILAINYKSRKRLNYEKDYSGKYKIKYEFWEIQPLEKSFILVLFDNINIQQTIERFIHNNKSLIPHKLTVLRVNKGEDGYIEKLFDKFGFSVSITEYSIEQFVWDLCIDQEWKTENKVSEEEFFIDQYLFHHNDSEENSNLGFSLNYIQNQFLNETNSIPIMMLFASGGMGKSTLSQILTNKINEKEGRKAILIQSEYIRENINKQVAKNYQISNVFQLYDIYMRLSSNNKSLLHEKQFDLGVLSGKITVIIDGLDEIITLFQENFKLEDFIDSLNSLNLQMGKSKIVITSRLNVLQSHPALWGNPNIDLVFLRGFDEKIWKRYLVKRYAKYANQSMYSSKTEKYLQAILEVGNNGTHTILPFYLDLICEIVEDEIKNVNSTFIVETVGNDYESNGEKIDYLIHAILKREIVRQQFNVSIIKLIDLFKEISVEHGNSITKKELEDLIKYFFDSNDTEEIYQKILLNPLLKTNSATDVLHFKYDFLSNYFTVLYLIENILCTNPGKTLEKTFIKQLDKLYNGSHILMDELVKYFGKKPDDCLGKVKIILAHLSKSIITDETNKLRYKHAISALLYLAQKIYGESLSKDKRKEILVTLYDDKKISQMFIWGKFYALNYENLEIWSSEFHSYDNLCSSSLKGTKFYHTQFDEINTNANCKQVTDAYFDMESCTLGNLILILNENVAKKENQVKVMEAELVKFFRNFFDRGNFFYKSLEDITVPSKLSSKPKFFIDFLIDENIIEKEPIVLKKSYGIKNIAQKDVKNLLMNNHASPVIKNLIDRLMSI